MMISAKIRRARERSRTMRWPTAQHNVITPPRAKPASTTSRRQGSAATCKLSEGTRRDARLAASSKQASAPSKQVIMPLTTLLGLRAKPEDATTRREADECEQVRAAARHCIGDMLMPQQMPAKCLFTPCRRHCVASAAPGHKCHRRASFRLMGLGTR